MSSHVVFTVCLIQIEREIKNISCYHYLKLDASFGSLGTKRLRLLSPPPKQRRPKQRARHCPPARHVHRSTGGMSMACHRACLYEHKLGPENRRLATWCSPQTLMWPRSATRGNGGTRWRQALWQQVVVHKQAIRHNHVTRSS